MPGATRRAAPALLAALACACGSDDAQRARAAYEHAALAAPPAAGAALQRTEEHFEVPPPPLSEGVFPCSGCHDEDFPVDRERRELVLAHEDIVLHHDEANRWCLDCHAAEDRDMLHLASGAKVSFEQSYRLCGQCHGDKYRDWRAGVHGRRTGRWDGEKRYLLCVHCHDAHHPAFAPIPPEPPPEPPRRTP